MEKFIVLDTETTNDIETPICYDVGFAVIDKEGNVYEKFSFVVADVFLDKELMKSAYFAEKIPQYWEEIKKGERVLKQYKNIKKILADTCKKWEVKAIVAHNMRFDYLSTNTTQRYLTCSKYRFFFPYGIEIWDTLKMARECFNDEEYDTFCYENDYITKNGRKRYTAEILYRFLTNNNNFIESHTGLEDVMIEKEIFVYCMRKIPKFVANCGKKEKKLWIF